MSTTAISAALLAAACAVAYAAGPAAAADADPLIGERAISTAHGSVAPECLSADNHRVTIAQLCFRGGKDHAWTIAPVPARLGTYLVRRGENCLTLDVSRQPHLSSVPCMTDHLNQAWAIVERADGEYQLSQGTVCVQAKQGQADADSCQRTRDTLGNDDSGQAWRISKLP